MTPACPTRLRRALPRGGSGPDWFDAQLLVPQRGPPKLDEHPDGPPARVDLSLGQRHTATRGHGVVVVVQAFACDEPGQPLVVRGQVVVRPLAPLVPDPVDGATAQQVD